MGCSGWDDQVAKVYARLAKEYDLDIRTGALGVERFPMGQKGETLEEWINGFIDGLNKLEPGKIYLFVEHPAIAGSEMEAVGHDGYYRVNEDRQMVTEVFTSEKVMRIIKERKIKLISYADLVE
ncbi:MAG: hypothetical protein KAR19_08620 [Bacteroidales bacterium]|nr:hypothetical protein [Bacteroidales bacterium]